MKNHAQEYLKAFYEKQEASPEQVEQRLFIACLGITVIMLITIALI